MTEMPQLNPWLIVARAVQIGACVLLFGQLAFTLFIEADGRPGRGVRRTLAAAIVAILLSGAAWLVLVAASVSGETMQALDAHTLGLVIGATTFGHVWSVRAGLLLVAAVALWLRARGIAFAAAAACLASLAWAGHAAAGVGTQRWIELASDMVHLIAAGTWLGALPALAWTLAHEAETDRLYRIVRRFSVCGVASVVALVATGVVNAWYRVGNVRGLVDSDYGRLLIVKLVLVAAMVALAARNRHRWTPELRGRQPRAAQALRRNTIAEIALGAAVVGIVGALGVTMPAAHAGMEHAMPAMHMGR
jgi:putative copper resistance protein D